MGGFGQADLALVGTGECALLVAEQLALQQRLGQPRAVHHHQRTAGTRAAGMQGAGEQLFAGAGLPLQQHRYLRRRGPLDTGKGLLEGRRTPYQAELLRLCRRHGDAGQALHERNHLALLVQDRAQFHVHMLRPARGVMHMQHPLGGAAMPGLAHRAVLPRLVARHRVVVRDVVALLADRRGAHHPELMQVRGVGGKNVVLQVEHDARLRFVFEVGHQRLQGGAGGCVGVHGHDGTRGKAGPQLNRTPRPLPKTASLCQPAARTVAGSFGQRVQTQVNRACWPGAGVNLRWHIS